MERTVKEPVNGKTVVSTIDLQVQSVVEKYIQQFNDERKNNATPGEGKQEYSGYGDEPADRGDPG